eukprot:3441895-Heterocapsa_arctica.AAC.1
MDFPTHSKAACGETVMQAVSRTRPRIEKTFTERVRFQEDDKAAQIIPLPRHKVCKSGDKTRGQGYVHLV